MTSEHFEWITPGEWPRRRGIMSRSAILSMGGQTQAPVAASQWRSPAHPRSSTQPHCRVAGRHPRPGPQSVDGPHSQREVLVLQALPEEHIASEVQRVKQRFTLSSQAAAPQSAAGSELQRGKHTPGREPTIRQRYPSRQCASTAQL